MHLQISQYLCLITLAQICLNLIFVSFFYTVCFKEGTHSLGFLWFQRRIHSAQSLLLFVKCFLPVPSGPLVAVWAICLALANELWAGIMCITSKIEHIIAEARPTHRVLFTFWQGDWHSSRPSLFGQLEALSDEQPGALAIDMKQMQGVHLCSSP